MAAGQDGDADDVDVLVEGGGHDLRRREADALVDDLEAGVAGRHGDLLGAVGVAVEAGLGDEEARGPAGAPARARVRARTRSSAPRWPTPAGHAGRGPVLAEDLAQGRRPTRRWCRRRGPGRSWPA